MTKIAAQMYTLREYTKTPLQIKESLHKVKEMGYSVVQLSALGKIDMYELKDILDKEGLSVAATHDSFDRLKNNSDDVIKEHSLWKCPYVGVGSMPPEYAHDEDGLKRFAKDASKVAKVYKDAGFTFIYHNHNFEFKKFSKRTGFEILFGESDPDVFFSEIDTFWVQYGGGDPAYWIEKMAGRVPVVHFKDMVMGDKSQLMAEVGEGNLNWKNIISSCEKAGVKWYIVEQDVCQRSPFDSLKISLDNLHAMNIK